MHQSLRKYGLALGFLASCLAAPIADANIIEAEGSYTLVIEAQTPGKADLIAPETAYLDGVENASLVEKLYQGTSDTKATPASSIVYEFAKNIDVDGAELYLYNGCSTSATVTVEIQKDGVWQTAKAIGLGTYVSGATNLRRFDGIISNDAGILSGNKARLRFSSASCVSVAEFRPKLTSNIMLSPSWSTAEGYVGSTGATVQLSASSRNAWNAQAMTYSLAPGSTLPSGASLSSSGQIVIGAIAPENHAFTVRAREGANGAWAERTFRISAITPGANTIIADTAFIGTTEDRSLVDQLYAGTSTYVTPSANLEYRFSEPVLIDGATLNLYNICGTATTVFVDVETDGAWRQVKEIGLGTTVTTSVNTRRYDGTMSNDGGTWAGDKMRLRFSQASCTHVYEFRPLRSGQAPLTPSWTTAEGYIGSTGATVQLAASSRNAWNTRAMVYSLAPGSTLPSGASLSSTGQIVIGAIAPENHAFTVRAREGTNGAWSERTFRISGATKGANELAPTSALVDGSAVTGLVASLHAQTTSTKATPASNLEYVLNEPVLIEGADLYLYNACGTGSSVFVDIETDGVWRQVKEITLGIYVSGTVNTRRFDSAFSNDGGTWVGDRARLRFSQASCVNVGEFRLRWNNSYPTAN